MCMSSYPSLPASSLETAYYTYYVLKIRNIFYSKVEEPPKNDGTQDKT